MMAHPWTVLGVLVILAAAVKAGETLRAGWKRRKSRAVRLRSEQEQKRFDPLATVYQPKGYRRAKEPRQ